jgi:transcriptional regulator with PAS, ATPase and Fis domain
MSRINIILEVLDEAGLTPLIARALRFVLRNPYDSLIVVDKDGRVEFMDRGSAKLFGLDSGGIRGARFQDLFPDSSLPRVLETGIPIVGRVFEIMGRSGIGSAYPIIADGKIIGGLSRLTRYSLEEVQNLNREISRLKKQVLYFKEKVQNEYDAIHVFDDILGTSFLIRDSVETAKKISLINSDALITGESGTGKELFAQGIHNFNSSDKPFVKVNCPAIPFDLAESELFGYEKGTFSGALTSGKIGKFEAANKGTIFLDEISSLPLSIQAKLLRVVQERELEKLGSTKAKKITFRLIAATNKDLRILVEQGKFRDDLYYRIAKAIIRVPSLRERREDIPIYLNHYLKKLNLAFQREIEGVTDKAMLAFMDYDWPGNVRELINILEQTILKAWNNKKIDGECLPNELLSVVSQSKKTKPAPYNSVREKIVDQERRLIMAGLKSMHGNKKETARFLGMPRSSLYKKMKKYNIKI